MIVLVGLIITFMNLMWHSLRRLLQIDLSSLLVHQFRLHKSKLTFSSGLVVLDPPYGLKVAEWDSEPFSVEALTELLAAVTFINSKGSFHLVLFCERSSYPEYVKTINNAFGPRMNHIAPHVLLKKIFPHGQDLGNAVVRLYDIYKDYFGHQDAADHSRTY